MAYQTGNASSITDLLNKLAVFAATIPGWVVDKSRNGELFLHNNEGYWSFGQTVTDKLAVLLISVNSGFNYSQSWDKQPGSSVANGKTIYDRYYKGVGTNFHTMPFSGYTFLGTAQYLHIVVRVDSRRFRHFGIGTLHKDGKYSEGQYAYGTYSVNLVDTTRGAYPFASELNNNSSYGFGAYYPSVIRFNGSDYIFGYYKGYSSITHLVPGSGAMGCGDSTEHRYQKKHPDNLLIEASLSVFNNSITLIPMSIYVRLKNEQYQRIGIVPDFYVARIDSVTPGTMQEVYGEKYYCCAATTYQTSTRDIEGEDNSFNLGYFYRVIE